MRLQFLAAALAATVLALPALADDAPDAATLDKVFALATKGYANPAAAKIRNVHKSAARNGLGWCGEVTVEDGDGFTIFHAILADEKGEGASVLRLVDFPDSDTSSNAEAVRRMMVNFGCSK